MKSSQVAAQRSVKQMRALLPLRFRQFMEPVPPDRLLLWLPLYRTPSPNDVYGSKWVVKYRLSKEAYCHLLGAQVSTFTCTGFISSTPTINMAPSSSSSMGCVTPGLFKMTGRKI